MAKIFHDAVALARTMQRIADNVDSGARELRPDFDPRERRELEAQAAAGKDVDAFGKVLEAHGFVWFPARVVARAAARNGLAPRASVGPQVGVEGQWRHVGLKAALTPSDIVGMFPSPEDLESWLKKKELEKKLARRRTPKAEIRQALRRSW